MCGATAAHESERMTPFRVLLKRHRHDFIKADHTGKLTYNDLLLQGSTVDAIARRAVLLDKDIGRGSTCVVLD